MPDRRWLVVLVLCVALDLGVTALPGFYGVEWDDDEEASHLERGARSRRPTAVSAPTAAAPEPIARLARPDGRRRDRSRPRGGSGSPPRGSAPPDEDH